MAFHEALEKDRELAIASLAARTKSIGPDLFSSEQGPSE